MENEADYWCGGCDGTGVCQDCGGDDEVIDDCWTCSGTGECEECEGTGEYEDE